MSEEANRRDLYLLDKLKLVLFGQDRRATDVSKRGGNQIESQPDKEEEMAQLKPAESISPRGARRNGKDATKSEKSIASFPFFSWTD